MKREVNGKMEKMFEARGGHGSSRPMGGGFRRPAGVSPKPAGSHIVKPIASHPASLHPRGYRPRNYPRGYRRPYWGTGGGWLVWNGVYWIDPIGMCYFENEYGDYIPANCIVSHNPIAQLNPDVLLSSADGKESEEENLSKSDIKKVVKSEIVKTHSSASNTAELIGSVVGTTLGGFIGSKLNKGIVVDILCAAIGAYIGFKSVRFANKNEVVQSVIHSKL